MAAARKVFLSLAAAPTLKIVKQELSRAAKDPSRNARDTCGANG